MRILVSVILIAVLNSGCTTIIDAVTPEPIAESRDKRSFGQSIDDSIIETKAEVNIRKASEDLKASHIAAISHNGLVLLVGQVPNEPARLTAAKVVQKIRDVRAVQNELEIAGVSSLFTRTADSWITGKVKTKLIGNAEIKSSRINVSTENGVVYLMGVVKQKTGQLASEIAQATGGVQRVVKVFEYVD